MIDIHHIKVDDVLLKLFEFYKVSTITELAQCLGMSQPAVTNWQRRNSINAIKKRCRELEDKFNEYLKSFIENNL